MTQEDYDKYKEACKIVRDFEFKILENQPPLSDKPFLGEDGKWYEYLRTDKIPGTPKRDSQNR